MASFYLAVYPSATTPTWDRTSGWSGTPTYTHADTDPGSVTSYTWDPDVSGLSAGVEYRLWAIWDDGAQSSNGPISSDAFKADTVHSVEGTLSCASSITGSALRFRAHAADGSLVAGSGSITGEALRFRAHAAEGALTAGAGSITGAAIRFRAHAAEGTLTAGQATINGAATRLGLHTASGAIVAGSGLIAGESTHVGEFFHNAEGALTGTAYITGAATRFRAHAAEGAIAAGQAQINGASTHIGVVVHEASGALTGAASVVGKAAAKHLHRCSGAIAAGPAVINGTVVSKHIHTCAGALVGSAEINGTTTHTGVVAGEVTLSAQTIADIVSAVLAAINATTIPVDVRKVVGTTVSGSGTESDPWGP